MEESRGGSHFMHDQVKVGSRLEIAHPVNLFALDKIARKHVLIAGGIGITPFLAQLEDLHHGGVPYELHYSRALARARGIPARLREREGERLHMYYDSEGAGDRLRAAARRISRSARMCMSAGLPA